MIIANLIKTKMKGIVVFVVLVLSACVMANAKRQFAEKENITLRETIADTAYNLNEPIGIKDNIQEKAIKKMDDVYRNPGCDDDVPNVCLKAFMKWCDKFVGEQRDYIVLRVPFNKRADRDGEFWPYKDIVRKHPYNVYENKGAQIVFDPFADQNTLNDFLIDNKVVIAVSKIEGEYTYIVNLNAVIPYDGKYYRCVGGYQFFNQLYFKRFKTNNIDTICGRLGNLIAEHPSSFVDRNGWLSMTFFAYYFKLDFDNRRYEYIQELKLNPTEEKITVKSLFYDNE